MRSMGKKKYFICIVIVMCMLLVQILPLNALADSKTQDTDVFTGKLIYDPVVDSDNPDIDLETYVPKDVKSYSMNLNENCSCKITIECLSGNGYAQLAIGQGELDKGFYQDIYLSPKECDNNVITEELDKGEYNLQIALQNGNKTDTAITYKMSIEYTASVDGETYSKDLVEENSEIKISDTSLDAVSGDIKWLHLIEDGMEIGSNDEEEAFEIKWSSDDKEVATIDKYGELTPRKQGICTITAKYKGTQYTCKVTVKKTKFSIVNEKINLNYNERKEVKFKSSPAYEGLYILPEEYETSNKKVAVFDFDNNEVIAKGKGNCKITFTFSNGQKASCTVTVGMPNFNQQLETQASYALDDLSITYNKKSYEYEADILIHNNKKKDATYIEFAVYQYDNKGERIYKSNSDYQYNGTIAAKDLKIVYCSVDANTKKVHACVTKVYYDDGSTWTNPLYSKWSKKYSNKY
jgi:Bacterial Ig-like domain (group 2).